MIRTFLPRIALLGAVTLGSSIEAAAVSQFMPEGEPELVVCSQLKEALEAYERIAADGGWPAVESGRAPKPGAIDPRMATLRDRLTISGDISRDDAASAPELYDATTEAGVRRFQARHGLTIDGVIGPATIAALNVPVHARVDQIATALDNCRADLRGLPDRFVVVNIAGFRVMFVEHGRVTWSSRVIVGTPYTRTPRFRADMQYVELNPTWTVPRSIVAGEILPTIRRDPGYLRRMGMKRIGDDFVQSPGPNNALGRIKLMMPNPHDVYLHDTPAKSLFRKAARAFSHGCIRVEKAVELAALALNDPAWSEQALQSAIDTGESRRISLPTPVPVVITSWPVSADREGAVEFLPDLYGDDHGDRRDEASAR